ncbi:MAG: hypothetical protein KJO36_05690 [Acidimicrobiia bacterium]|nr:hypothetical protein [Acidimicrobiia bacterium]NNL47432.1 hypothetical protein [Acidimicrobiia bacterium]
MLIVMVQSSFVLVVRNESKAIVDQAARSLTRESADPAAIIQATRRRLTAVTGDAAVEVEHVLSEATAVVATFDWAPPGPSWGTIELHVESSAYPVIVP